MTLIELLVVIAILGVLASVLISKIDPLGQFNKTRDARRQHDMQQLKTALDAYYNDHNKYPLTLLELTGGDQPYIKNLPKDPSTGSDYVYTIDTTKPNPQWNALFTKLSKAQTNQNSCQASGLVNNANCPIYNSNLGCVVSGQVDCDYLATHLPPEDGIVPTSPPLTSTPTPTPTSTPTPTPTPIFANCADESTEQVYSQNMVACNGTNVSFDQAGRLCGVSSHACTIDEYLRYGGVTIPTNDNHRFRWINSITGQLTSCQDGKSAYLGGSSHVLNTANFLSYIGGCGLNQGYFYTDYDYTTANTFPPSNGGAMCCSN